MLTVYGLGHCTTTKKGINILEAGGRRVQEQIDIRDNPPSAEIIQIAIDLADGNPRKIMNTSGNLYREMALKDKLDAMSENEIITLLASHGMLIKRPLVTDGETVTVGAKESTLAENWLNN